MRRFREGNEMRPVKEILRRKEARRARLRASLDSIVGQLRRMGALKIILFGSLVTEDVDVNSDLDLVVVMPASQSGREWTKLIYEEIERGVASDILVFNQNEFREKLDASSFLQNVVSQGRVMYENKPQRRGVEMAHSGAGRIRRR